MAAKTVADLLVQTLAAAGVERLCWSPAIPSTESPTRSDGRARFNGFTCVTKRQPPSRPVQKHI